MTGSGGWKSPAVSGAFCHLKANFERSEAQVLNFNVHCVL